MSATTPLLGWRVPTEPDGADVPRDVDNLADDIEQDLTHGDGKAGWTAGDIKQSVKPADHARWLRLDGRAAMTQGNIETALSLAAGEADDFIALIKTGSACIFGTAPSGKILVPDTRRRIMVGAGPSGDGSGSLSARDLGASGGEERHLLIANESGVATHAHTLSDPGHNHTLHDPGHGHGAPATTLESVGSGAGPQLGPAASGTPVWVNTYFALGHGISSSGTGITLDPRGAGITVNNEGPHDASNDHNNMPPFVVVSYFFIRV